jgi:hypothetical protein
VRVVVHLSIILNKRPIWIKEIWEKKLEGCNYEKILLSVVSYCNIEMDEFCLVKTITENFGENKHAVHRKKSFRFFVSRAFFSSSCL